MSKISILFRRDRVWLTVSVSMLLAIAVVGFILQHVRTFDANAFATGDVTNTGAAADTVAIGQQDVPIMNLLLPAPAADTLIHDGVGPAEAGVILADFDAAEQFADTDHDARRTMSAARLS